MNKIILDRLLLISASAVFCVISSLISLFVLPVATAQAASCTPATGLGTATNTSFPVTASGTYKLWVRMKAADTVNNTVGLKAGASNAVATCLSAGGTNLSSTTWEWKLAGEAALSSAGNTVTLFGLQPGVSVDRVISVINSSTCVPSNTRITSTNVEPGDNCLTTPTTTITPTVTPTPTITPTVTPTPTTTTTVTPSPTTTTTVTPKPTPTTTTTVTPTPTTTVTPKPTPTVTPVPTPAAPVGPAGVYPTLSYDWQRGQYYISLAWAPATGSVTGYEVRKNGAVASNNTANQTAYNDFALRPDTAYAYQVVALNGGLRSQGSAVYTTTIRCFWVFCGLQ